MFFASDIVKTDSGDVRVFSNKTKQLHYTFVEKKDGISLGCDVYKDVNGRKEKMEFFSVAAYTKEQSQRMDYNSILPYISIIQAGKRTILSFNCDFIVLNQDKVSEKIMQTKDLYGLLSETSIELKQH